MAIGSSRSVLSIVCRPLHMRRFSPDLPKNGKGDKIKKKDFRDDERQEVRERK